MAVEKAIPAAYAAPCKTCGAQIGEPCRDLFVAPLVIRKTNDKRKKQMLADMPAMKDTHDARKMSIGAKRNQ